ncbi:ATP-dependent helicase [Clostridium autoethanogenum]|uniref:DNA 3'-5' helicase n=2 Tax=Clostridium autoethanogenum TaxID=84023 RepID=A0ABM5NZD0_9CLOT|nr:ATP-dependent helicase [Clostridium autoethanogenum]AGY77950.1 ATP-dependent helicase [Clostridium autoethanogenum DSM 10061]ALU38084.1 Superfamily I DNA helicase [Clostridium autoethanogenum DSM 10061]OVY50848.1 putative ATP-dependent DNA helicase YjcD [Clostridium autoethanogenum]
MNLEVLKTEFKYLRDKIIEKQYEHLDPMQRKAVLNGENNCIVIACPGAGKTQTIINRVDYLCRFGPIYNTDYVPNCLKTDDLQIMKKYLNDNSFKDVTAVNKIEHLLNSNKINPQNIVVITFTRAAALNMKNRYISIGNKEKSPFFGTFHSLFYNILKKHNKEINIIDPYKAHEIVKNTLMYYLDFIGEERVKEVLNDISLLKNSETNIDLFKSKIDKSVFLKCFNEYENYKARNKLMDFDDLQLKVKDMFLNQKSILDSYQNLFKYILVDEFQDSDNLQIELLQLIGSKGVIFAVGDEDQCIYSFRGSKPECMVNFDNYFKDGRKIYLKINYRSVKNVVELSKKIICNNKNRNVKLIENNRKNDGNIYFKVFEREKEQAFFVSNSIKEIINKGKYKYSHIAVFYRTNLESRSIIDAFLKYNIKFKLLDGQYNFYEHFICKDLIAYLKLAVNMCDKNSFMRIINKPFRYIGKVNIKKVIDNRIRENCFDILRQVGDLPIFQLKNITVLEKNIRKLNRMKKQDRINYILDKLDYMDYLKNYCMKLNRDMDELQDIIGEFREACGEFDSIESFLDNVGKVEQTLEKGKKEGNTVTLSTIHGVKGMEFENVFIINCSEGLIPHANSIQNNLEEERRLFYVGVTRAIDNLTLCYSSTIRKKAVDVSRFIEECDLLNSGELMKNCGLETGDYVVHKVFGSGKIIDKGDNCLKVLFSDNREIGFDLSVLYNGQLMKDAARKCL